MSASTDGIRNVAIVGHGSTGKTTLLEQMLAAGGVIPKPEPVESGKTVSDYAEEEISRGISIHAALAHVNWKDTKINLLDTPGASDFVGEVIPALRAADSVLLMVAAEAGVQIGTIQIWRRIRQRNLPAVVFINKMDKDHADFGKAVSDLKENFETNFVPLAIPMGAAGSFKGVVNLIEKKAYLEGKPAEIPQDMAAEIEERRLALIEAAAEGDDALMEKFFETETLSDEEIVEGIRKGIRSRKVVPVFCGSALANAGVTALLDAVAALCPSPAGKEEPLAGEVGQDGQTAAAKPITPEGGPSAFVFRTAIDQFSGRLSFVKVITGTIHGDSELVNSREKKREKVTKVYTCQG
ncbi:MAG: GTP-binding protein, partial [Spirochaetales bacterium]|nr:GTP-binding protein [Spirochaetales bacterium]